ncbi:transcription factor TCP12-like [Punica granatum]|uniref:Uncharacterized protein n=2 Tax=Punica granatum TaxID=22663 RepID=A0A218WTG6_PUNGR|nr:transcription factor TCP12-like [Punica granatum]OWM75808.1 hypothetical protein CDL15_Pgr009452 [Punica granatum]PKI55953.1 hypothetical protein CRG98_023685 [Punica granatum]
MFPPSSFSDLHLQYTDKALVIGRSSSPIGPTFYDLDDELIFEQLFFQEGQVTEARADVDINFTGSCYMMVETTEGANQAGNPISPDRVLPSMVRPSKKTRGKAAGSRKLQLMPRKRIGKKDRHSKIRTAQGLRDRRIRLSVHIARKFFDLQEMLGLDKASETIDWLLSESEGAIDELSKKKCSHLNMDSTPESAVVSETKEAEEEEEEEEGGQESGQSKEKKACRITRTRRDSRNKARERARERTREKLVMKGLNVEDSKQANEKPGNPKGGNLDGRVLGSPDNCRDSDHFGGHEMNASSIIERFLGITSTTTKPSSYPDLNLEYGCYEMIGGVDFLEGNVQEIADSNSPSLFMASYGGPQCNPNSILLNIPGLSQPKTA